MARALWLPDVLRDAGLPVSVASGWESRGSSSFNPQWLVEHHTASACCKNSPALGIVINGRAGLPGPLANYHTARNGHITVVASGRANHAGSGRYPDGTYGNSRSLGNEAENNGVGEPWGGQQKENIEIAAAAICRHLGWGADRVIGHKEYTSRKIDPTYSMPQHRARVAELISTGGGGTPPPPNRKGMQVFTLIQRGPGGPIAAFDGTTKEFAPNNTVVGGHRIVLAALGQPNDVIVVDPGYYDSIKDRSDIAFDLHQARGIIDQTVAGVLAGLPPGGGGDCNPAVIADAVADELAQRLTA